MEGQGLLEGLIQAFSEQVGELREATLLRVDGAPRTRSRLRQRCRPSARPAAPSCRRLPPPPGAPAHVAVPVAHPPHAPLRTDTTRALYSQDVEAIEATVRALEHRLRDIRASLAREAAAIPQVCFGAVP